MRCGSDWSSDVCSSDLDNLALVVIWHAYVHRVAPDVHQCEIVKTRGFLSDQRVVLLDALLQAWRPGVVELRSRRDVDHVAPLESFGDALQEFAEGFSERDRFGEPKKQAVRQQPRPMAVQPSND